jgi:hypothetical protein
MKNRVFAFLSSFLVIGSALVLASCGTAQIAYKSSAPPEKLCTLLIAGQSLTIKSFNGEDVEWKPGGLGDFWLRVDIPEGSHVFKMDVVMGVGQSIAKADDVSFRYDNFTAGRTYRMWPKPTGFYS